MISSVPLFPYPFFIFDIDVSFFVNKDSYCVHMTFSSCPV